MHNSLAFFAPLPPGLKIYVSELAIHTTVDIGKVDCTLHHIVK